MTSTLRFLIVPVLIISFSFSCRWNFKNSDQINKDIVQHTKDFIEFLPYHPYQDSLTSQEITLIIKKLNNNKFRLGYAQFNSNYGICKKYKYGRVLDLNDYSVYIFSDSIVDELIELDSKFDCNQCSNKNFQTEYEHTFPFRGFNVNSSGEITDSMGRWQWILPSERN